jgi:hypothetical protein
MINRLIRCINCGCYLAKTFDSAGKGRVGRIMNNQWKQRTSKKPDLVLLLSITNPTSTNQVLNPCPLGKVCELAI